MSLPQPGNRFVSFVRGGVRREIIGLLGMVRPWTVPPAAARSRERLAWLGLAFGFWFFASFFCFFSFLLFLLCVCALGFWLLAFVRSCAWLLAFGLPAPAALARLCAWFLAFVLAFGLWLLAFGFR